MYTVQTVNHWIPMSIPVSLPCRMVYTYPHVAEQHSLQGSRTEHHNCVCNLSLYYYASNAMVLFSLEGNTLFVNCTLLGQRPRRILNQFESRLTVVRTPSWSANAQALTLGIFVIPNLKFEFSNFIFLIIFFKLILQGSGWCCVLIGNLKLFRLVHPHWIGYLIDLIPSGLFVDCVSIHSMPY